MQIQTLEPATKLIHTRIKASRKRELGEVSIASVYRELRGNTAFSFVGDFPLIGLATKELCKAGFIPARSALVKLVNGSDIGWLPLADRKALLEQLREAYLGHEINELAREKRTFQARMSLGKGT